jgi:outer membrane immunogenic protein
MKVMAIGGLAVSALLIAAPLSIANSADMPLKAPPPPPAPVWSWTGFYIGGNVGGVWGDVSNNWILGPSFTTATPGVLALTNQPFHPSSVLGGAQLGYNYQFNSIVAGLEADISGLHLNSSRSSSLTGIGAFAPGSFTTETANSSYLATVRGGLAVAHVTYTDFLNYNNVGATQFAQSSQTRTGWTAGGGAEYAMAKNWSVKAEYLYVDLGSSSAVSSIVPLGFSSGFNITHQHSLTEQIGRVGVNYKLN